MLVRIMNSTKKKVFQELVVVMMNCNHLLALPHIYHLQELQRSLFLLAFSDV